MDDQTYIQRLRAAMRERTYDTAEIEACSAYAQALLSKDLPVLFDARHVDRVLRLGMIDLCGYHTFSLSQRTGKERTITAPSRPLKQRQKWILSQILSKLPVSPCAHGFESGRSIRTNALLHAGHDYVLCLDIQDFFPSIPRWSVVAVFQAAGYSPGASQLLADVCCFDGVLPQGAPTSPRLSNIIFRDLDGQLAAIAAEEGAIYSRYADDLTFSSDHGLARIPERVRGPLLEHGFSLNQEKVHFYGPGVPKRITGLVVQNGTVRVPKRFKRTLRQEIHYCSQYGVLTHLENSGSPRYINYREYLYGKAYYIHMIEPEVGEKFLQQLDRIIWPPNLLEEGQ